MRRLPFVAFGFAVLISGCLEGGFGGRVRENVVIVETVVGEGAYLKGGSRYWRKLHEGVELSAGSEIRTKQGSVITINMHSSGRHLRLSGLCNVKLETLNVDDSGPDRIIETRIALREGRIIGHVTHVGRESIYAIETRFGSISTRGAWYDIRDDGTVSVFAGELLIVYSGCEGGQPVRVSEGQMAHPALRPGEAVPITYDAAVDKDLDVFVQF